MPRPSLTTARPGSPPASATAADTLRRTSTRGIRTTGKIGGGKLGAALKLVAGFGLALAVVLYVEALLAVFPSPVWTTLLLLPPLAAAGLAFDTARRRRLAGKLHHATPLQQPAPARPPSPAVAPQAAPPPAESAPLATPAVEDPLADAIECFNASAFPRTVAGIAKSLGPPKVSILPADESKDVLITVAWELSWYQYRADPRAPEPVQLEDRGQELDELADAFQAWNAEVDAQGRLVAESTVATGP